MFVWFTHLHVGPKVRILFRLFRTVQGACTSLRQESAHSGLRVWVPDVHCPSGEYCEPPDTAEMELKNS
jgi:hypothetical protein